MSTPDATTIMRTALAAQRPRLLAAALLAALATGCAIGLMATSGWLISRASEMPPVLSLGIAIVCVRAFGIGRGVFRYTERLVSHDATFRALTDLRVAVYRRLERLAPTGVAGYRRGDLLGRLVGDVDALQDLPLRVRLPRTSALAAGAASVAVTWWLLPAAGLVLALALLIGGVVVPSLAVRADRHARTAAADRRGDLSAQVLDLLRGSADLSAAGAVPSALARLDATDSALTATDRTTARAFGVASALAVLTAGAAVLGAILVGVPAVDSGRLDGVLLAVVVLLPLAAYEAVVGLPAAALAADGVTASADRITTIVSGAEPVAAPAEPRPLAVPASSRDHLLRLRGVSARWPGAERDAITDVDLDLTAGTRVAVVGPSGAGKSTLSATLVRFLDHTGTATLDGVPLRELDEDAVRSVVGLCAQDAHVFDTTLAENLRLARPDASDAELHGVLAQVRLTSWVDELPAGLDTAVGEHGSRMSGGQRQRLAVARSLLADPAILVLDEPTEHLDDATATALTTDLLDLTRGRTTLLVTHRLDGLDAVDEVLVMDAGRITDRGTHADLVARGVLPASV